MAYPIFQSFDCPSGVQTQLNISLPPKGHLRYAGITGHAGAAQGPGFAVMALKTSGFTIGIGKPGWVRNDSSGVPTDFVSWSGSAPLGTVSPGTNQLILFVRNDTGATTTFDAIGYVED